ncbi:MAG: hypothetical protein ACI4XM_07105 [Candidatus Coprovivens sp.]
MTSKKNKFSAFKLFYDEFVYRLNDAVSYKNVEIHINNIRELTMDLRKTPKYDISQYMTKLSRINKRIKEQLDNILIKDRKFLEFFLILYKNHKELSNDKVEDVPFIISTSFYDDYRLDNKSITELESSSYIIPRYTSLEKKNIRLEAKRFSRLEYFIKLLRNSKNTLLYDKFLVKISYMLKLKPVINESHYDYFRRLDSHMIECERLWERLEEKAKTNEDYENISEIMEIAYKKKFIDWNKEIKAIINEYFDNLYSEMKNSNEVKGKFDLTNDISFETFRENVDMLVEEKESLMKDYESGNFSSYIYDGDSYLLQFKKILIDSFFDYRFKTRINMNDDIDLFVDRAIELYSLATDLENQIFEKITFDASHSSELKRGNDATTALIVKIYELYNPLYLLSIFEKSKNEFEKLLDAKNIDFKREYNIKLLDKKIEYDFHGPLPTMKSIRTKIVERRKEFILEHCITELFSRDLLKSYDTRNYDLNIVAKDISVSDMVNLYYRMKNKIDEFNFDNMNYLDRGLVLEGFEKQITLSALQEFVVKNIFKKLKCKSVNDLDLYNKYNDICRKYLNEDVIFINDDKKEDTISIDDFEEIRNIFVRNSGWNMFLKNNKLRGFLE